MAPIIPVLLILLIPTLLTIGAVLFLGLKGVKSGGLKKIFGIIVIISAVALIIYIAGMGYGVMNHEDHQRAQFIGTYKSNIDSNDAEYVELTITFSSFSITANTITKCTSGTWKPGLTDNGYIIILECPNGKYFEQFYLNGEELIPVNGNLRFIKVKE